MLFRAMISLTDVGLLCSTTRPGIKRFFCRPHSPPTPTPLEALRAVTLLYFESAVRSTSCLHGHPTLEGHSNRVVKSSGQHCVSKSLRVGNEESGRIWSEVQVFEESMIDSSPPPASKVNHVGVFAIHLAEPSCERPRERGCAIMFTSYIFPILQVRDCRQALLVTFLKRTQDASLDPHRLDTIKERTVHVFNFF